MNLLKRGVRDNLIGSAMRINDFLLFTHVRYVQRGPIIGEIEGDHKTMIWGAGDESRFF